MFLLPLLLLSSTSADVNPPDQVHLSFTGDLTEMAVVWNTYYAGNQRVRYNPVGVSATLTASDTVIEWTFGETTRYTHRAVMVNLQPDTKYEYYIDQRKFTFKTMPLNPQSYRACIFGDLGVYEGLSTENLIKDGLNGEFDFIVHVGDIAYDLHTNDGQNGDDYMNNLEPLLSSMPYMVIAGNHEDDGKNFTNYQKRFWMPENGFSDNQFYSFDLGPVHWLGISTENYGYFYSYGVEPVKTQFNWLKNDLKKANENRDQVPWIATFQHRPFYCSNDNSAECQSFENRLVRTGWLDMEGLEPLLLENSIDFGFWGHEHSYERFFPIADKRFWNDTDCYVNPQAPVYVVTGSAGCHSYPSTFGEIQPFSAARSNDFGYTIMTVANRTHVHLEQIGLQDGKKVVDEIWVVKDPNDKNRIRSTISNGHPFPPRKCHVKDVNCRRSLRDANREL